MEKLFNSIRHSVRKVMHHIARTLHTMSNGKITPNGVTIFGFLMHLPIAVLIASHHLGWAAVLLIVFGLFDALDGELARLQNTASEKGMLLDASTDRMKEVLLYAGAAYLLAGTAHPHQATWAVLAVGASLCVSYVKAKGEAAVASRKNIPHAELNRMFADGFARFEVRMAILVIGLLGNQLAFAVALVAILATYTAIKRLIVISKRL